MLKPREDMLKPPKLPPRPRPPQAIAGETVLTIVLRATAEVASILVKRFMVRFLKNRCSISAAHWPAENRSEPWPKALQRKRSFLFPTKISHTSGLIIPPSRRPGAEQPPTTNLLKQQKTAPPSAPTRRRTAGPSRCFLPVRHAGGFIRPANFAASPRHPRWSPWASVPAASSG